MALNAAEKTEVVDQFKRADKDTGSVEVQVALLTKNIKKLTLHFKEHKKDVHSRRGLLAMVNKRRKLLSYIKRVDLQRYLKLVKALEIRH